MTLRLKHFVGILLAVLMVAFASIRANAGTPTGIVFFNTSKVSSSDTNWDAVPYVHTGDADWGSAHCMSSTSVSHVYYYAWTSTPTAVVFKNNNNDDCKQTEDGGRYTVSGLLYTLSGNTNGDNRYTFVDAQGTVPTLTANKNNNDTYYSYNNVLTFSCNLLNIVLK